MSELKEYLNLLTIDEILKNPLPHRFYAYYASQCARMVIEHIKDPRSLLAIEVVERYGNGENFSKEYLIQITDAASAAAYDASATASASAYTSNAANAAYTVANAASATAYAYTVDYTSNAAASTRKVGVKKLLIDLIEERLTEVEKVLIFNIK